MKRIPIPQDGASPFTPQAADLLAVAVFRAVERGSIHTRTAISDALESWADLRFGVMDGTGIQRIATLIADAKRSVRASDLGYDRDEGRTPRALSVEEVQWWLEVTGAPDPDYLFNLAEIGAELLDVTGQHCPDFAPAQCPTEIVVHLVDERDEARESLAGAIAVLRGLEWAGAGGRCPSCGESKDSEQHDTACYLAQVLDAADDHDETRG